MKSTAITEQPHWWKKGQSGNPKGRPKKGDTMADYIKLATDQELNGYPVRAMIAEMLVMLSLGALDPKIRLQAIGMIIDYSDGRAPTRILNATDEDGTTIPFIIERSAS